MCLDAEDVGQVWLALDQVSGLHQGEQLGRLVPAGPGRVRLHLAYDVGQCTGRIRDRAHLVHLASFASGSLTQACTSPSACSIVVTFTSRILSGS